LLAVVNKILELGGDPNAHELLFRDTPLHQACAQGHVEVVGALLAAKGSINATAIEDWTPLHRAVRSGHVDVVEKLIEKGANLSARINAPFTKYHNLTPKELAQTIDRNDIAEIIGSHTGPEMRSSQTRKISGAPSVRKKKRSSGEDGRLRESRKTGESPPKARRPRTTEYVQVSDEKTEYKFSLKDTSDTTSSSKRSRNGIRGNARVDAQLNLLRKRLIRIESGQKQFQNLPDKIATIEKELLSKSELTSKDPSTSKHVKHELEKYKEELEGHEERIQELLKLIDSRKDVEARLMGRIQYLEFFMSFMLFIFIAFGLFTGARS